MKLKSFNLLVDFGRRGTIEIEVPIDSNLQPVIELHDYHADWYADYWHTVAAQERFHRATGRNFTIIDRRRRAEPAKGNETGKEDQPQ